MDDAECDRLREPVNEALIDRCEMLRQKYMNLKRRTEEMEAIQKARRESATNEMELERLVREVISQQRQGLASSSSWHRVCDFIKERDDRLEEWRKEHAILVKELEHSGMSQEELWKEESS